MSRFTRRACYKLSGGASAVIGWHLRRHQVFEQLAQHVGRKLAGADRDEQLGQVFAVRGPGDQTAQADLRAGGEVDREHPGHRLGGAPRSHVAHGDLADAPGHGRRPQAGQGEQPDGRAGQGAVAVGPLRPDVLDVGIRRHRRQAPVGLQPGVLGGDVVLGEVGVARHVEGHRGWGRAGLAPRLGHRLGHQLDVEVVPDGGDVARLVGAEQVARAADLEVAHGDLESGSELGVLADRPQPLVGLLAEHPVGRMEEVRVGALPAATHPAPDLVQLPEAQQVGPVDDEGVDRRHVDAGLDDGRAHQHVVAALPEVEHHRLEAALVHLPVRDGHPRLGDQAAAPHAPRPRCPTPGCARRRPAPRGAAHAGAPR